MQREGRDGLMGMSQALVHLGASATKRSWRAACQTPVVRAATEEQDADKDTCSHCLAAIAKAPA